jgi:hypothetical protein
MEAKISSQVVAFQDILNAAGLKDALQVQLIAELATRNVSSFEFVDFTRLKKRVASLFFEKGSFLYNIFLDSNKLAFAKRYFTL